LTYIVLKHTRVMRNDLALTATNALDG